MLEPLIVSTRACELITSKLGLTLHRRGVGLFGKDTERKDLLIFGDVDSDFLAPLKKFAVKITMVRTVPRYSDSSPLDKDIRELFGAVQLAALDSGQFPLLIIADPASLSQEAYYQLWRVLDGHAKGVAWVPAYLTNPLTEESLRLLGAVDTDVTPLSEYDFPGNHLHYFETRKDQSKFHKI